MRTFVVRKDHQSLVLPQIPRDILANGNLIIGCADDTGTCVGVSVFQVENENIRLIYIFVAEQYRRKGAGTAMLDYMIRVVRRSSLHGIEINFFLGPDTKGYDNFFQSVGFSEDPEDKVQEFSTTLSSLASNAPRGKTPADLQFLNLSMVSSAKFYQAGQDLKSSVPADSYLPLLPKDCYSQDFSFLAFKDEKSLGGIMIRELARNEMEVSYLWMNQQNAAVLFALVNASLNAAVKELPERTIVRALAYTRDGATLMKRLCGKVIDYRIPVRYLYAG